MSDERVWRVVGEDAEPLDIPPKRFITVALIAVAVGFALAYVVF